MTKQNKMKQREMPNNTKQSKKTRQKNKKKNTNVKSKR